MTPWLGRSRSFTLAALATGYPTSETLSALREASPTEAALAPLLLAGALDADGLRGAFARCFDVGKKRVPLYETEYGRMRGLSKGKDLADVVGFYRAFGLDVTDGGEVPDHVAVELEFYALLAYKQHLLADDPEGSAIVADARRKFLQDHLGGFVGALAAAEPVATDPVYGPLFAWVAALVAEECAREGVAPAPLDFFDRGEAGEPTECGACVAIPGVGGTPPTA